MMKARNRSAMTRRSFQSASASATTPTTMSAATNVLRAVSFMPGLSP
jgi:hypothetical protein